MSTRRFWQIHLSTAILLMVMAGIVFGMNISPSWMLIRWDSETAEPVSIDEAMKINMEASEDNHKPTLVSFLKIRRYGWPVLFWERTNRCVAINREWHDYRIIDAGWLYECYGSPIAEPFNFDSNSGPVKRLIVNSLAWIGILVLSACICETLIRRREARKP
jgi:hypothetical protein